MKQLFEAVAAEEQRRAAQTAERVTEPASHGAQGEGEPVISQSCTHCVSLYLIRIPLNHFSDSVSSPVL